MVYAVEIRYLLTLGRELQTVVLLSIPIFEQNPHKNGEAAEKIHSVRVKI
jgi:hypothetical protein